MNEIQIFTGAFGTIRTVTLNNEPYFVGKDVADILGYSNPRDALSKHVDDEDRSDVAIYDGSQNRNMTIINESGLYSLILRSQLPTAKQFKHWVTSEVLPTIRKHGMYATPQTLEQMLNDPDSMIKVLQTLKEERTARLQAEETNRLNAPKVLFADSVAQADTDILIGELAKILKQNGVETGQNRLYDRLRADGFIMKNSTIPTQKGMEMGLFHVIERSITQPNGTTRVTKTTKVTGNGQIYFINRYAAKKARN